MAGGRDWDSLADSTKQRYERHGVTRASYEGGASLKAARGHEFTPERPGAGKEREEYRSYYELRREITQLKREIFGRLGSGSIGEMRGKSRATLEKAAAYLREMKDNQYTWEEMLEMYPELQDESWEWLRHYH